MERKLLQQQALATLKQNLHLPNGGFHILIVELCCEYQLPFQSVRRVVREAQSKIEQVIFDDVAAIFDQNLSQENWLKLIHQELEQMAKESVPVLDAMREDAVYKKIKSAAQLQSVDSETHTARLNDLNDVYQRVVYRSLKAMLHTSKLYWELKEKLFEMTDERCERFSNYSQHVKAIKQLQSLAEYLTDKVEQ